MWNKLHKIYRMLSNKYDLESKPRNQTRKASGTKSAALWKGQWATMSKWKK